MDDRRLSTEEILNSGILGRSDPKSAAPSLDNAFNVEEYADEGVLRAALQNPDYDGLVGCMYYGVWIIWKQPGGLFGGELKQYRAVTDSFVNQNLGVALEKAVYWAARCAD